MKSSDKFALLTRVGEHFSSISISIYGDRVFINLYIWAEVEYLWSYTDETLFWAEGAKYYKQFVPNKLLT